MNQLKLIIDMKTCKWEQGTWSVQLLSAYSPSALINIRCIFMNKLHRVSHEKNQILNTQHKNELAELFTRELSKY